jgi:hypothetical protein
MRFKSHHYVMRGKTETGTTSQTAGWQKEINIMDTNKKGAAANDAQKSGTGRPILGANGNGLQEVYDTLSETCRVYRITDDQVVAFVRNAIKSARRFATRRWTPLSAMFRRSTRRKLDGRKNGSTFSTCFEGSIREVHCEKFRRRNQDNPLLPYLRLPR